MLTMQNTWDRQQALSQHHPQSAYGSTPSQLSLGGSSSNTSDSGNNNNSTIQIAASDLRWENGNYVPSDIKMERSTSAPPSSSFGEVRRNRDFLDDRDSMEADKFLFGFGENYGGGKALSSVPQSNSYIDSTSSVSQFLHSSKNGRQTSNYDLNNIDHIFDTSKQDSLGTQENTSFEDHMGGLNINGVFDNDINQTSSNEKNINHFTGERSQSATPRITRPPPGMENVRSSPSFNKYNTQVDSLHSSNSQSGLKRPASTGVIGDPNRNIHGSSTSTMGRNYVGTTATIYSLASGMKGNAENEYSDDSSSNREKVTTNVGSSDNLRLSTVRPSPRTLMDLIQEDFPKTPSPEFLNMGDSLKQQRSKTASPPRTIDLFETSLAPTSTKVSENNDGMKHLQNRHNHNVESNDNINISKESALPLEAPQLYPVNEASHKEENRASSLNDPKKHLNMSGSTPQYVAVPVSQLRSTNIANQANLPHAHRSRPSSNQNMYPNTTAAPTSAPHVSHLQGEVAQIHHIPPAYEVPIYYASQRQHQHHSTNATESQVVHHHPQPVFVNGNGAYYTLQYHHPNSSMQESHHPHTGPPHQPEYISILPIHGHPHLAAMPSANGAYAYWHTGHPHSHPTIVSTDHPSSTGGVGDMPHGTAIKIHSSGAPQLVVSSSELPQKQQTQRVKGSGARNSSEKNKKKGRKNGGSSGVGSGNELSTSRHLNVNGNNSNGASSILEEFRNSKNKRWTVHDLRGHIYEFCQDQNGSRFIQQRLEVCDSAEKEAVMTEVLPYVKVLRNDVFGNYVVQKLLEHGTQEIKARMRETLVGEMLPLALQMYGCRVVQKALEMLSDEYVIPLLMEYRGHVINCIHDQNGNHVMQKCIEVMSSKAKNGSLGDAETSYSETIEFIISDVLSNAASLSCHPYGCRVMQRILEHCVDEQRVRALDAVSNCHRMLLDDQYGNYVIQHVLQFGRKADKNSILKIVVESGLLTLSRQKFASNVVEKLLKYGSPENRTTMVREMLKRTGDDSAEGNNCSVVLLMVRDAYANYVVQTTLDVVPVGEERRALLAELNKNSAQLRNYTFAKHIVAKLNV